MPGRSADLRYAKQNVSSLTVYPSATACAGASGASNERRHGPRLSVSPGLLRIDPWGTELRDKRGASKDNGCSKGTAGRNSSRCASQYMIDLHTHTNESDGTLSPQQLIEASQRIGLQALAITDHDTLAGYDLAVPHAPRAGIELVCGVELSINCSGRSIHLLVYFLRNPPTHDFRQWLLSLQAGRRKRNEALVRKLCSQGMPITLEEVAAHGGRLLARPHFAAVMIEKGYAASRREAFDKYLDEAGSCYVSRQEPHFGEAMDRIRAAQGIAVLPHPSRIGLSWEQLQPMVVDMCDLGLKGIEVYHSDHSPAETDFYLHLARKFGMAATGGSDFHGETKPGIALGTGKGSNLKLPYSILEELRQIL